MNIDKFNSVLSFIEWVGQQPADREWDYSDNCDCVFASYAKEACDSINPNIGGFFYYDHDCERTEFNPWQQRLSHAMSSHSVLYRLDTHFLRSYFGV